MNQMVAWEAHHVEFLVDVGSRDGVLVQADPDVFEANVNFRNINLPIDGYNLSLWPFIGFSVGVDDWGTQYKGHFLSSLTVLVSYSTDLLRQHRQFDNKLHYLRPRRAGQQGLRHVLSHLRSVAPDVSAVDIQLSGLRFVAFKDELLQEVDAPDLWNDLDIPSELAGHAMTEEVWERVAREAEAGREIPIGKSWLLDAKSFLAARNTSMALTAAAVACEIFAYELIRRGLTGTGRVSANQASAFLDEVSNRVLLPTMLRFLDIIEPTLIGVVTQVFADRNAIIHGKQKTPALPEKAQAAIHAAEALEARLLTI